MQAMVGQSDMAARTSGRIEVDRTGRPRSLDQLREALRSCIPSRHSKLGLGCYAGQYDQCYVDRGDS